MSKQKRRAQAIMRARYVASFAGPDLSHYRPRHVLGINQQAAINDEVAERLSDTERTGEK